MNLVFADTFYYLALVNADDDAHEAAVIVSEKIVGKVVTTEFVLVEVADALSDSRQRRIFRSLYQTMCGDENVEIVSATHDLFEAGAAMFWNRLDKDWSLTDCISFCVMKQQKIRNALTGDRHFSQAGFNILF